MWEILLAAAVGAVVSLLGWVLRSVWESRRARVKTRLQYVADIIDSGVIKEVDNYYATSLDFHAFYEATEKVPLPSTLADLEADGDLSAVRRRVLDQVRDLYDLRMMENAAGRHFSDVFNAEALAFTRRLSRWAKGRGSAEDIYKMLP